MLKTFAWMIHVSIFCLFMEQVHMFALEFRHKNGQAAPELSGLWPALVDHLIGAGSQANGAGLSYQIYHAVILPSF